MEELLKNKLGAAKEFMSITREILSLSPKAEYEKISLLIEKRQQYIEKINVIDEEINKVQEITESDEVKRLKGEIREIFRETSNMDNFIRKNLNSEPETPTKLVNIKA